MMSTFVLGTATICKLMQKITLALNFIHKTIMNQCPDMLDSITVMLQIINIGEIHYHKENKTNGVKQIEFSAESNQFEKSNQKWE